MNRESTGKGEATDTIRINRPPVLTLWAAVVAEQLVTGISGGAERERTSLANAAATLDRLGAAA